MKFAPIAALALMLMTSGCGTTLGSMSLIGSNASSATAQSVAPKNKQEFIKEVAARGVKLTEAQLELISKGRSVQPNGTFAARPAANLTAEQNLDVHFKKHAHEFTPAIASAEEYLQRAMDVASGKRGEITYYFDTTSFQKGYQSQVVRWNVKSKEFTALRPDGAVTTLYLNYKLASKRFVEVPLF